MNRGNFRGTGARSRSGSQQNRIRNQNGHLSNRTILGPAPLDQDYISYQSDQSFHFPTQDRQGFPPNHFNHPPSRGFFNQAQPRHAHNIPPFSSVPINKINPRIPSQTFHSQRQNVGKQNNDRMALQTEERNNSAIKKKTKENQQRKGNARPIIPLFPTSNHGQSISCIKVSPTATEKDTVLSSEGLVQFKTDVKDMLEQRPDKSVKFTSFIQTFHKLLGRQCKLSSYGYTRLIQLLEALPDVVKIQGTGDERIVSLIMKESEGNQDENKIQMCTGEMAPRGKKKKNTREKTKEVVHESESASLFQFKTKQEVPLEIIVGTESEQESNNDSDNESVFSMVSQVQELYLDDGIEHSDNLAVDFASKQETQCENEIAIFWDIENCPVPKTLSTSDFVKRIREKFCSFGWKEIEFIAINDGQNEKLNNELHELRIETSLSVIGRKNSADDVMKDKMNCFVEKRSKPCTLLLISGDVDFSRDLAKFRYTYKYKTILMHNRQAKETLKSVVAECICIEDFAGTISPKDKKKKSDKKKSKVLNVEDNVGISKANLPENTLCIEVEFKDSQVSSKSVNIFLNELNSSLCQKLLIESTFDEKSVIIKFSSDQKTLQAKTSLRIRSGKKKLKKCKDFFESLSDDNIKILCFYEKLESTGDIFFNDDIKKKSVKDLKSKIARLQKVHNSRIDSIKSKVEEQRQFEDDKKEEHKNATKIFKSSEQNQASNAVTVNLTEEIKDLEDQLTEFKETCEKMIKDIEMLDSRENRNDFRKSLSNIRFNLAKEMATFESPLPIYKYRRQIQNSVENTAVTILMAETGSGKSTQVVQYIHELFPNKMIVCTQPRKIAAVSLANHVAKQMGSSVGGLVGYHVGSQKKSSKETKIIFMTDQMLLNECLKDPNFSKYNCVVLDEVHERSINTDLLLGLTKDGLKINKDLRVVITSATMDPKLFYDHFQDENTTVKKLQIPGRTFPIDIFWEKKNVDTTRNYLDAALRKTEEVLRKTTRGDILVFLATPADTDQLANKLKIKNKDVESLQLHGKLQIDEQKKIFETSLKRKVIFATNCAETSVTVPGITTVIDPGVAKEKKFDPVRNTSSLVIQKINKSSAKQRAGRAGRTEPGVCYRLYSEEDFIGMNSDMIPEIKRIQLGQTILKLLNLGIQRPDLFPFIESPGMENLKSAMENLESLGAIEIDNDTPKLTKIGRQMAKLPIDPRLSKLILLANDEGSGEAALILASLCSMAGSVFFRMGSGEECSQADQKKLNFCNENGDFLTLIEVYKTWFQVNEKKKSKWCVDNYINGKSMKIARDMILDLKSTFQKECKLKLTAMDMPEKDREKLLLKIIFECFRNNLCLYGGHNRLGYINIRTLDVLPLHPSSSFTYLGNMTPKLIIYDQILTTSRTFLLNLSLVEEEWLNEDDKKMVEEAENLVVTKHKYSPVGPRILKQSIIGVKQEGLRKLERNVKEAIGENSFFELHCDVNDGCINWSANNLYHRVIENILKEKLMPLQKNLEQECLQKPLLDTRDLPKAIIGGGGILKDIVLENEYSEIMIKRDNSSDNEDYQQIIGYAKTCEGVYRFTSIRKSGDAIVGFEDVFMAKQALGYLKTLACELNFAIRNIYPLKSSGQSKTQTGLDMKITFRRRKYRNFGFIKFETEEDAYDAMMKIDGYLYLENHMEIRPTFGKGDKKSFYFRLGDMVSTDTTEYIKNSLKAKNICFSDVFVPMESAYDSTNDEMKSIQIGLGSLLTSSDLATARDFDVDVRMRRPKDHFWVAKVNFLNTAQGLYVGDFIKKRVPSVRWSQTPTTTRMEKITVEFSMSTSFSCKRKIFDILKETIEKTIKDVTQICDSSSELSLDIKPFQAGEHGRAVFILKCMDMKMLAMAKDALDDIMKGEKLDHPNIRLVLTPGNQEKLRDIEETSEVFLEKDIKMGYLTIYGSDAQTNDAKTKINRLLGKIIDDGHNTYHENIKNFPNGLVKDMIKAFGSDFKDLHEIEGVHSVKYLVNLRKIEIESSELGYQEAKEAINDLARSLTTCTDEDVETCPVCFTPPESSERFRLQNCGHLYCTDCLKMQINSASWPLVCSAEDCNAMLVVEDFKYLENDENLMQKLQRNALEHKLLSDSCTLKACPSPNCQGVFRVLQKDETSDKIDPFFCVFCGVNICRRCCSVYHYGMTCQFYQIYRADDNHSLRVWLEEDPEYRKLCPKCKSPIEKNGGCLHIHCIKCGSHMCWFCQVIYPTGSGVYNHMCSVRR